MLNNDVAPPLVLGRVRNADRDDGDVRMLGQELVCSPGQAVFERQMLRRGIRRTFIESVQLHRRETPIQELTFRKDGNDASFAQTVEGAFKELGITSGLGVDGQNAACFEDLACDGYPEKACERPKVARPIMRECGNQHSRIKHHVHVIGRDEQRALLAYRGAADDLDIAEIGPYCKPRQVP